MLSLRFDSETYNPMNPDAKTFVVLMGHPPSLTDMRRMQDLGYTVYLVPPRGSDIPLEAL